MALLKLKDYSPSYHEILGDNDIIGSNVYADATEETIGTVKDILVDEENGKVRYLILDLGFWIFGKKVPLPVGLCKVNLPENRVHACITKEQAENLPEFSDDLRIDHDYEEHVRTVYRSASAAASNPVAPIGPIDLGMVASLGIPEIAPSSAAKNHTPTTHRSAVYSYGDEPYLYGINHVIRLYEERLASN